MNEDEKYFFDLNDWLRETSTTKYLEHEFDKQLDCIRFYDNGAAVFFVADKTYQPLIDS